MNIQFHRYNLTGKASDLLQKYVDIKGSRLMYASFVEMPGGAADVPENYVIRRFGDFVSWSNAQEATCTNTVYDNMRDDFRFFTGFPADANNRQHAIFEFRGALLVDLSCHGWGYDEIVDCSLFDVVMEKYQTPIGFYNRFEKTKLTKITYSDRYRKYIDLNTGCNIFFPFATTRFEDAAHIGISHGKYEPIGPTPSIRVPDGKPGTKLVDEIYCVIPESSSLQVVANGTKRVRFRLEWPKSDDYRKAGGELMEQPVEVTVKSSSGYIPVRKFMTRDGRGEFDFVALGLKPGHQVKLKIGVGHMTKIGEIFLEVVSA